MVEPAIPALPLEHHPALQQEAKFLRAAPSRDHTLRTALPMRASARAWTDPPDMDSGPRYLTFTRKKAAGSLDHRFGTYVWSVWVDGLGRMVGVDDAAWVGREPCASMWGEGVPLDDSGGVLFDG